MTQNDIAWQQAQIAGHRAEAEIAESKANIKLIQAKEATENAMRDAKTAGAWMQLITEPIKATGSLAKGIAAL